MQLKIKQEIKDERDIIKVITGTQIVDAAVRAASSENCYSQTPSI